MALKHRPLSADVATREIRKMARHPLVSLHYAHRVNYVGHAEERMAERNVMTGDILHILKNGDVLEEADNSLVKEFFKYKMQCITPNSGARSVGVVLIPYFKKVEIEIITVMWIDEAQTRAGHREPRPRSPV